jgi:hypothetical protein
VIVTWLSPRLPPSWYTASDFVSSSKTTVIGLFSHSNAKFGPILVSCVVRLQSSRLGAATAIAESSKAIASALAAATATGKFRLLRTPAAATRGDPTRTPPPRSGTWSLPNTASIGLDAGQTRREATSTYSIRVNSSRRRNTPRRRELREWDEGSRFREFPARLRRSVKEAASPYPAVRYHRTARLADAPPRRNHGAFSERQSAHCPTYLACWRQTLPCWCRHRPEMWRTSAALRTPVSQAIQSPDNRNAATGPLRSRCHSGGRKSPGLIEFTMPSSEGVERTSKRLDLLRSRSSCCPRISLTSARMIPRYESVFEYRRGGQYAMIYINCANREQAR